MKKLFILTVLSMLLSSNLVSFSADKTVVYNWNTKIYHSPNCASAIRCTKCCDRITLSEAIKKGGRPCKKCGAQ